MDDDLTCETCKFAALSDCADPCAQCGDYGKWQAVGSRPEECTEEVAASCAGNPDNCAICYAEEVVRLTGQREKRESEEAADVA